MYQYGLQYNWSINGSKSLDTSQNTSCMALHGVSVADPSRPAPFLLSSLKSHSQMEAPRLREALLRTMHPIAGHEQRRVVVHLQGAQESTQGRSAGRMYPLR